MATSGCASADTAAAALGEPLTRALKEVARDGASENGSRGAKYGAALNGGLNFATDTLVAVADNGTYGFMIIGSK